MPASIRNLDAIKTKLRAAAQRKAEQMAEGLKLAGLYLQAESQKIVPVDYGPLKASAFTRSSGTYFGAGGEVIALPINREGGGISGGISIQIGYTAGYAVYVHENPDAAHGTAFNVKHAAAIAAHPKSGPYRHSRGPDQVFKFLERPFRQMLNDGTFAAIMQQAMT